MPAVSVEDQCASTFGLPVCPHWDSDQQCDKLLCATDEWTCVFDDSPVLDGSSCGDGRWCIAGQCVDEGVMRPPEPPAPEELLRNGGFEDGDEPWAVWGGAARAEGAGRGGCWALRATERNGAAFSSPEYTHGSFRSGSTRTRAERPGSPRPPVRRGASRHPLVRSGDSP